MSNPRDIKSEQTRLNGINKNIRNKSCQGRSYMSIFFSLNRSRTDFRSDGGKSLE
jgi:hypothetical protein